MGGILRSYWCAFFMFVPVFLGFLALPVSGQVEVDELARLLQARMEAREMEKKALQELRARMSESRKIQQMKEREIQARLAELRAVQEMRQEDRKEDRVQALQERKALESEIRAIQEAREEALSQERSRARQERKVLERERALRQTVESRAREGQERIREQERNLRRAMERAEAREALTKNRLDEMQQVVVRLRSRVRLGVELDPDQAAEDDELGVRILGVLEESPAEKAGLREGDVITHLNGRSLLDPLPDDEERNLDDDESLPVQRLMELAGELEEGEEVELRYLRDGQDRTVTMEAAEMDAPRIRFFRGEDRVGEEGTHPEGRFRWHHVLPRGGGVYRFGPGRDLEIVIPHLDELQELEELEGLELPRLEGFEELEHLEELENLKNLDLGRRGGILFRRDQPGGGFMTWSVGPGGFVAGLRAVDLNPELGEYFSVSEGALVLEVDEGSNLGLRPGDVIQAVDNREVADVADLRRILRSYEEGEPISFRVVRRGEAISVDATWGDRS